MAGDWLKMRTRLAEERSVMLICDLTGLDTFSVVGRLHAIWSWAGEHTTNGEVQDVTLKTIDRVTNFSGFADAMKAAKWLEISESGVIRFPEWKKYNSKAAKRRALDAARQARKRARKVTQKSRTERDGERDENVTVTHQEKRREEESITSTTKVVEEARTPQTRKRKVFSKPTLDDVRAYCATRARGVDPERWYAHYEANGWKVGRTAMVDWQAAVRKWEEPTKPAAESRYVSPDSEASKEWTPW